MAFWWATVPVNDADGIGRLGVVGIFHQDLLLPFSGVVKLIGAEVDGCDLLQTVDVVWILGEHLLEVFNGRAAVFKLSGVSRPGTTF